MGKKAWEDTRMDGKVTVITGANAGLGKVSALDLARRGAKVYMLGRNKEKLEAAAQEVLEATKVEPSMVQVMLVDLASLESVREFAASFKKKETRIDVLMNNAGIMMKPKGKTADGFELQFGTNVLGPFLLTHLLMDQLLAAAPGSRVVNLSSLAHTLGKGDMQWDNLMFDKNYEPADAYCQSKLANLLFNLELSKRVKSAGITCYAMHPGAVATNLQTGVRRRYACLAHCMRPFMKSPENGAETQIMRAVDRSIAEDTGYYYVDCKRKTPSQPAQNEESAGGFGISVFTW